VSPSKKHHIVPQSILKNFSYLGHKQQIYVYDKKTSKSFLSSIVDAGSENYFNTVKAGEFELNFEELFDEVDETFSKLVSKLIAAQSTTCLSIEEKERLIVCLAHQYMRTKMRRTTLISVQQQLKERIEKEGWSSENVPVPDEEQAKMAHLLQLAEMEDLVRSFDEKLLIVLISSDKLWISDNPIVMHNGLPYGDLGIKERGIEIYFPVSEHLVLGLFCPSMIETLKEKYPQFHVQPLLEHFLSKMPMSAQHVRYLNRLQVYSSSRFIYSSGNDFAIADEILNQHPEYREVRTQITVGEMGKGPLPKRNMPAGDYLVVYGKRFNHMIKVNVIECHITAKFTTDNKAEMQRLENDKPHQRANIYSDGRVTKHLGSPDIRKHQQDGKEYYELGYQDETIEQLFKTVLKEKKSGGLTR
jgi:hypothetical protein